MVIVPIEVSVVFLGSEPLKDKSNVLVSKELSCVFVAALGKEKLLMVGRFSTSS